jgi:hypothetical protein
MAVSWSLKARIRRVGHIYGVYTVNLAGKSPDIRSYTVYVYGSGQPYVSVMRVVTVSFK